MGTESGGGRKTLLLAIVAGLIVTKVVYFIPVVQIVAPLFGGATTAFILNNGPIDGLKAGFLKGVAMFIPAIILATIFAELLAEIPIVGSLLAGSVMLIVVVIVMKSMIMGMIGGFISGAIAQVVRKSAPSDVSGAGSNATEGTAKTATTADDVKGTHTEHREDVNADRKQRGSSDSATVAKRESGGANSTESSADKSSASQRAGDGLESSDRPESASTAGGTSRSRSASTADETPPERDEDESTSPCRECDEPVADDVNFCSECGATSPTADEPETDGPETDTADTDVTSSTPSGIARADVGRAAESVERRLRPTSPVARQLCRVLAGPETDEEAVEATLETAVSDLEAVAAVTDELQTVGEMTDAAEIESIRRRVEREGAELGAGLGPIFDAVTATQSKVESRQRESEQVLDASRTAVREAQRAGILEEETAGDLDNPETVVACSEELATAFRSGEVVAVDSSLATAAAEVERTVRPETPVSIDLLETLSTRERQEFERVLRTTIETLEECIELQSATADIREDDVIRRLDSLDAELRREDDSVHRHIADRIREFEAVLDRGEVDPVRLYAIYQECTFYDRTLLPRLSRSAGKSTTGDVSGSVVDIEDRIAAVEDEFITRRADHNHTIPRHFLSLARDLCGQAGRIERRDPERADGILIATEELLDGIETLYERNEYSVMLRRLRG